MSGSADVEAVGSDVSERRGASSEIVGRSPPFVAQVGPVRLLPKSGGSPWLPELSLAVVQQ